MRGRFRIGGDTTGTAPMHQKTFSRKAKRFGKNSGWRLGRIGLHAELRRSIADISDLGFLEVWDTRMRLGGSARRIDAKTIEFEG